MIENYIPQGHANAVTRQYLAAKLGLPDRTVRQLIEASPELIANTGDGYFRYKDESDLPYIRKYIQRETGRAISMRSKALTLNKKLRELQLREQRRFYGKGDN